MSLLKIYDEIFQARKLWFQSDIVEHLVMCIQILAGQLIQLLPNFWSFGANLHFLNIPNQHVRILTSSFLFINNWVIDGHVNQKLHNPKDSSVTLN